MCKLWGSESRHIPWFIRLWAAVIRRAAVDWVLYRHHKSMKLRRWGIDADLWLFQEDDTKTLCGFKSVCAALNLDHDLVRSKIKALTEDEARRLRGMEFGDDL